MGGVDGNGRRLAELQQVNEFRNRERVVRRILSWPEADPSPYRRILEIGPIGDNEHSNVGHNAPRSIVQRREIGRAHV